MRQYRAIRTALQAAVACLFGLVLTGREWFVAFNAGYGEYAHLASLIALFFVFRMAEPVANIIVERIPLVSRTLRRVMAGKDCIEGDWPLVVIGGDIAGGKPALSYLGYLTISYEGGQLKVRGRDWFPDGRHAHDFESQQSRLDRNLLQYWYHQGADARMRGYSEVYFFPEDGTKIRHAGEFLDKEHNTAARFYAGKLPGQHKRPKSEAERFAAAQQFWASIEAEIGKIAARPVSADWE